MTAPRPAVLDASYMVEVLLGSAELPDAPLSAPGHFDAEVVSALMRLHRRGVLDHDDVAAFVQLVVAVDIHRVAAAPLAERVVELRDAVAVPDAWYVALAEVLGATLFTADLRLAAACRQQGWCPAVTPLRT